MTANPTNTQTRRAPGPQFATAQGGAVATVTPPRPTRDQFKPFRDVKTIDEALRHPDMAARIKAAMPRHLSPERMLRVLALACHKTPKLKECDLMTLMGAMLACASLGLEPNTPLGHAYLIPFEKRKNQGGQWVTERVDVNLIIGYRGYIDLARRSGHVVSIHADVIYEGDEFSFEYGSNMHLMHRPIGSRENRRPEWAYAHVKLTDGEAFEVLPYPEVLRIRDGSEGYKSAVSSQRRGNQRAHDASPWVAHEHEMAAKTMVRRIAKMLPLSIEFANAAALDGMSETGRADLARIAAAADSGQVIDAEDVANLAELAEEAEAQKPVVAQGAAAAGAQTTTSSQQAQPSADAGQDPQIPEAPFVITDPADGADLPYDDPADAHADMAKILTEAKTRDAVESAWEKNGLLMDQLRTAGEGRRADALVKMYADRLDQIAGRPVAGQGKGGLF